MSYHVHVDLGHGFVINFAKWNPPSDSNSMFVGGVVGGDPNSPFVPTGIAMGPVSVSVELLATQPELDDSWEDIVEVSLLPDRAPIRVVGWTRATHNGQELALDEIPPLSQSHGWHRVRISVSGRDTRPDGIVSEPVEKYLFQSWPAPLQPSREIWATSQAARNLIGTDATNHS